MTDELKPCPFCGGKDLDFMDVLREIHVHCYDCRAESAEFDGATDGLLRNMERAREQAAEAWNARAEADALRAEVERMQSLLKVTDIRCDQCARPAQQATEDGWATCGICAPGSPQ